MYVEKQALVALGGNLSFGDIVPELVLKQAVARLREQGICLEKISPFYRTPAFPAGSGPDYVNAAISLNIPSSIDATELLQNLHQIEAEFGRERGQRWAGRTLDLDLIALDQEIVPNIDQQNYWRALSPQDQAKLTPEWLILPHPRLQDRAFVLVPLADVAPDWVHPVLGLSVRQMLAALPAAARAEVVPI